MMSNVKYIYLFFKVNKCSDLVAYDRSRTRCELASYLVLQSVNLLPVGRSPSKGYDPMSQTAKLFSIDRSPSRGCLPISLGYVRCYHDYRDQTEYSKLKTACFITCVPPLGQRPGLFFNGLSWVFGVTYPVTVGVGNSAPHHRECSLGLKHLRELNNWRYFLTETFAYITTPDQKFSLWVCCLLDNCSHIILDFGKNCSHRLVSVRVTFQLRAGDRVNPATSCFASRSSANDVQDPRSLAFGDSHCQVQFESQSRQVGRTLPMRSCARLSHPSSIRVIE